MYIIIHVYVCVFCHCRLPHVTRDGEVVLPDLYRWSPRHTKRWRDNSGPLAKKKSTRKRRRNKEMWRRPEIKPRSSTHMKLHALKLTKTSVVFIMTSSLIIIISIMYYYWKSVWYNRLCQPFLCLILFLIPMLMLFSKTITTKINNNKHTPREKRDASNSRVPWRWVGRVWGGRRGLGMQATLEFRVGVDV